MSRKLTTQSDGTVSRRSVKATFSRRLSDDNSEWVVNEIWEEILQKTFLEIEQRHRQKHVIKFVVECVYEALTKFITINFYHHDQNMFENSLAWKPEAPCAPSPQDSWACHAVEMYSTKNQLEDQMAELEDVSLQCRYECKECIDDKELGGAANTPADTSKVSVQEIVPSRRSLRRSSGNKVKTSIMPSSPRAEDSVVESSVAHTENDSECSSWECKEVKRRPKQKKVSLPKIVIPIATQTAFAEEPLQLPPIRAETRVQCKPGVIEETKSASKKKN